MIFSCKTSVAVLKSRTRTKPRMHSTVVPWTLVLMPALSEPRMLWLMMWAPASPKPKAKREPNLMIVFSKITVSMG